MKICKLLLIATVLLSAVTNTAIARKGMRDQQSCTAECATSYTECKKTQTADSAVNKISCKELQQMCKERCSNISEYVSCEDKCAKDKNPSQCLSKCKSNFSDNTSDYKPYMEHKNK